MSSWGNRVGGWTKFEKWGEQAIYQQCNNTKCVIAYNKKSAIELVFKPLCSAN